MLKAWRGILGCAFAENLNFPATVFENFVNKQIETKA